VTFILKPAESISPNDAAVLKVLLNAEPFEINPDYQPIKGTPVAHSQMGELFLPTEGLIDVVAEKTRIGKELEKVRVEIGKVEQKLANPRFVQNAPPEVLQEHQKRLADWQAKQQQLQRALEALS
jgi:valyl-tRNA synthetase